MLLKSSSSTELETGVVSLPSRQRVGLLRFAGPDGLEIDVLEALTRENAVFDYLRRDLRHCLRARSRLDGLCVRSAVFSVF